jgi:hypothetical protein
MAPGFCLARAISSFSDFTGIVVMEVALKGQLLAALSAGRMPSGS